jgi:hypothetical protein
LQKSFKKNATLAISKLLENWFEEEKPVELFKM